MNHNKGDIGLLPIPSQILNSLELNKLGQAAVEMVSKELWGDELSLEFVYPGHVVDHVQLLSRITKEIDSEVLNLLGLSSIPPIIEEILQTPLVSDDTDVEEESGDADEETDGDEEDKESLSTTSAAWISYAVGIVLGRFTPGVDNALGKGKFESDVAHKLLAHADTDGIMVLDARHPDDMASRISQVLQLALGSESSTQIIENVCGSGDAEENLRKYFEKKFFDEHIKKYKKRPVYWLLQSLKRNYSIYIFHERFTKDTLHRIRGEEYVGAKLKQLETDINDLRKLRINAQGKESREIDKQLGDLEAIFTDVKAFAGKIDELTHGAYKPHIDDGILLNMAPLWELIPSWHEPKVCWQALIKGDYDWSNQAMDHRPNQVREVCKKNKSFAIAHGLT